MLRDKRNIVAVGTLEQRIIYNVVICYSDIRKFSVGSHLHGIDDQSCSGLHNPSRRHAAALRHGTYV